MNYMHIASQYRLVQVYVLGGSPDNMSHLFCRANAQQPKLFVGMILILIFAEALALYGLIGKFQGLLSPSCRR